jgi:hypothetical protein
VQAQQHGLRPGQQIEAAPPRSSIRRSRSPLFTCRVCKLVRCTTTGITGHHGSQNTVFTPTTPFIMVTATFDVALRQSTASLMTRSVSVCCVSSKQVRRHPALDRRQHSQPGSSCSNMARRRRQSQSHRYRVAWLRLR